ncbi:hypothetical protein QL285_012013 [Trifolium repens]|nr:hypothetical protein QL285_012013 [Trifolium repens]
MMNSFWWGHSGARNKGSRWRIGSGNNIPLINENWLFDASSLQLQQTEVSLAGHLVVADVILPDTKCWNLPLLTTLLNSSGVNKVLNTPLFDSVSEDKRIWRMEKNGAYSVRSAYRLCVQELLDTSHLRMDASPQVLVDIPNCIEHILINEML